MKNNLISAIAGWKSAALLALIAVVAGVAFSGILTNSAQAVEPGKSQNVTIAVTRPSGDGAGVARFEIDPLSTSSGSFDVGGGQTVVCNDAGKCDIGKQTDGTDTANSVTVKLNIDEDSADGFILVKITDVLAATPTVTYQTVEVETLPKPASLAAKAVSKTIDANGSVAAVGDAGRTEIVATVKDNQTPSVGMSAQRLTFVTTLGVMDCPASGSGDTAISAAPNVQWCQVWTSRSNSDGETAAEGNAVISLKASGREGTATVTISHGTLDPTIVEVTLYGTAKNVSAEAEQSSVEVGGSVFVVLTVTDAAGNPVRNAQPQPADTDPIVAPEKDANKVTTSQAADDNDAATSPYNVNKDPKVTADATTNVVSKDAGDIPSCGVLAAVNATPDATPPGPGNFDSTGTDDNGQCVVQVNATPDDASTPTSEASARGVHTLNFALTGTEGASVEITVAGPAAAIESDAPESVEALSDTTITVTVRDEDGVLVGDTGINVIKVAGDGLAEGAATMKGARTKNGSASFSYAAGLEGRVVFRVIASEGAGAIRDVITLTVGELAPEGPAPTWNKPLATGTNLYVWNGEDGAPASAGVPEGVNVVAIWEWTGSSWNGYFPEAAAEGITAGDLTELENGEAYFVVVQQ
ncbi:MAG: hypothetical protein F4Z77_07315 [Dehalococcoidia bacterium]|nr:hypothetical protein [Dehalococcoidia bacterium]